MSTKIRSAALGLLAVGACMAAVAGTAQAAVSTTGRTGAAKTHAVPAVKKGCKAYNLYEVNREVEGGLELCKKSGAWFGTGIFEVESGYYIVSGPEIELVETSRDGEEECYFYGSKGKKKIAYAGNWVCYFGDEGSIEGNWEAEKL